LSEKEYLSALTYIANIPSRHLIYHLLPSISD